VAAVRQNNTETKVLHESSPKLLLPSEIWYRWKYAVTATFEERASCALQSHRIVEIEVI